MDNSVEVSRIAEPVFANRYLILLIVLTGTIMSILDGSVVNIAMPTITAYFHVGLASSEWIIMGYLVAMTSLLLICGKASEYFGKANVFIAGFTIFTLSSLACGLSGNLSQLILFRIVQGIGAAMVFSISGAILMTAFPPNERGRAIGYLAAAVGIGLMIGPTVGGNIVDLLGWQYIFFVNVPIGIVMLAVALKYLKIPERRAREFRMDWIGAPLLVIAMSALVLALGELAKSIEVTTTLMAYGALFALTLALFVLRELSYKEPLIDLSVLKVKGFALPLIAMTIYMAVVSCLGVASPFSLQGVFGMTPSIVGWIGMIVPLIMILGSPVSGWIYDKYGMRNLAPVGIAIFGLALFVNGYALHVGNLWLVLALTFVMGAGCAIFQSPNNTDVMTALPERQMSLASSVASTSRNLGSALGVSLASIMISTQLSSAGYTGVIIRAGPILPDIMANVVYLAGGLCLVAALFSIKRTGKARKPTESEPIKGSEPL